MDTNRPHSLNDLRAMKLRPGQPIPAEALATIGQSVQYWELRSHDPCGPFFFNGPFAAQVIDVHPIAGVQLALEPPGTPSPESSCVACLRCVDRDGNSFVQRFVPHASVDVMGAATDRFWIPVPRFTE